MELPKGAGIEKLRELVLELAVAGRLDTHNAADTPASELLESLRSEKARKITVKELRKGKPTPTIEDDEIRHGLPDGWQWVRLQEFGEFCGGGTPSKRKSEFWDGDVPWVSPKDMKSPHIVDSELKITQNALDNTRIRLLPTGSILIVARSGILKRTLPVSINDIPCTVNQDLKVIIPFDTCVSEYLRLMLRGHERYILKHLIKGGVTVQSLKYAEFELQPFPLPPLAEQRRIVSKVEGLMSLCDTLESHRLARMSVRERARRSVLVRLTSASAPATTPSHKKPAQASPETLQSSWQRLSDHFEVLLDQPSGVDELRQSILQLAVQGKLVPQDPSDEPASVALKTVSSHKQLLLVDKKLKKQWKFSAIEPKDEPFEIPGGWTWCRILDTAERVTVGHVGSMKDEYVDEGVPFLRTLNVRELRYEPIGLKFISPEFHESLAKSALAPGDVLVVRSGNVGTTCVVPDSLPDANCSDLVIVKVPIAVDPNYLAIYMNSAAKVHVEAGTVGVALTHFNTKSVASMPLSLPPQAEQKRIVSKVSVLLSQLDELSTEMRSRQSTTDALLTALIHQILKGTNGDGE